MPCSPTWCRWPDSRDFHKAQEVNQAIPWECPSRWIPLNNNNNSCKCNKWMLKAFSKATPVNKDHLRAQVNLDQDNLKPLLEDKANNTELNPVSSRDLLLTITKWEDNQCQVCWVACLMQSLIKWTNQVLCKVEITILDHLVLRNQESPCTPFILVIWLTLFLNSIYSSSSKLKGISSGTQE